MNQNMLDTATKVAWSMIGKPYMWGGDDPMAGFDCSGLVVEILQSVGMIGRYEDLSAQGLFNKYKERGKVWFPKSTVYLDGMTSVEPESLPKEGCLVFWHANMEDHRVIHVEYCINEYLSIGASGGGSKTKTVQAAIDQNAYIKVRPYATRTNLYGFADPFGVKMS